MYLVSGRPLARCFPGCSIKDASRAVDRSRPCVCLLRCTSHLKLSGERSTAQGVHLAHYLLQLAACRHTGSEQPCAHRFQNRGISFENISRAVDRSRAASRRLGAVSVLTTRRCGSLLTAAVSRAPHHSWGEPNRHPVKAPHFQSSRPGTEYLASCFPRSRFSGRPAQETCAEDILPELR